MPVALVTGSTSGIGEAIARRLVADGYDVVVNSRTSADAGARLVDELGADHAHYVQADIASGDDVDRLIRSTVDRFGGLDVLVNNAGTTVVIPHHELEAATPDVFRQIYDVNVVGTWQLTVAAMPHLRDRNGCVVNISSLAGLRPVGSSIPYAVSKAALNHLTRLLANTVAPEVRVNAVAPGLIDTPWTADWEIVREGVRAMAPMKRSGHPDDVVELVVALIRSAYVTGEVWAVDGGMNLR